MKKRLTSMLLAAVMMFSAVSVVGGEVDHESLILRAREYFDIREDMDDVDISKYGENTTISWTDTETGESSHITADEHGCITGYFYSHNREEKGKKLNRNEAKNIADALLKKIYGENVADIVFDKRRISGQDIRLYYYVAKNGVPVDSDIEVEVDRVTGKIDNFSGVCNDIFGYGYIDPKSVKLLDSDQIYENYKETDDFELIYNIFYNYEEKKAEARPVYRLTGKDINAVSGEPVDAVNDEPIMKNTEATTYAAADAEAGAGITPEERKAIEEFENYISKEEADEILKKHFPQLNKMEIRSSSVYREMYFDVPYIEVYYDLDSEEEDGNAYASLNAENGEILSYYCNIYKKGERIQNIKLDEQKAVSAAEKKFAELAPKEFESGEYKVRFNDNTVYFDRIENGVPVNLQNVRFTFDNEFEVTDYIKDWDNITFPSLDNVTDERALFEKCINDNDGFGLVYRLVNNTPVLTYSFNIENVYGINRMYDAVTGERINSYNGEPYSAQSDGNYSDLEGSPYREVIEILAEYGHTLPYEKFEPGKEITIGDFYTLCNSYVAKDDQDTKYNKPMTKMDMVKIFVEQSGYDGIAKKDIFKNNFSDVGGEDVGYVAIAAAMGYIQETGGEFNGGKVLTRGEAAEYIYSLLEKEDEF